MHGSDRGRGPPGTTKRVPTKAWIATLSDVPVTMAAIRAADLPSEHEPLLTSPTGRFVRISQSIRTFVSLGMKCVACDREAKAFAELRIRKSNRSRLIPFSLEKRGWTMNLHSDHVLPRSAQGATQLGNLVPLCNLCGTRKGDAVLFSIEKRYRPGDVKDELVATLGRSNPAFQDWFDDMYVPDFQSLDRYRPYYMRKPDLSVYLKEIQNRQGLSVNPESIVPQFFPSGPLDLAPCMPDREWLREVAGRIWRRLVSEKTL